MVSKWLWQITLISLVSILNFGLWIEFKHSLGVKYGIISLKEGVRQSSISASGGNMILIHEWV